MKSTSIRPEPRLTVQGGVAARETTAQLDTIQPPPPPRPTHEHVATLGLWVQTTPDPRRAGTVLDLDQAVSVTVGRGADVTFTFEDTWQSRDHFRVCRHGDGWLLEDLGARNGTQVCGERVERILLRPGDVVRAGATVFVFDYGVSGDPLADLGLTGVSAALDKVRGQIRTLATGTRPIHLTGESGVGKEVVAHALHSASGRSGPVLALNMATIVANLAESQLFGHRRGAFSGAVGDQQGAFDVAHQGTLLLDEMAELDPAIQAKLLRAVETGQIHRVGDALPRHVDVRLITATHRDLAEMVTLGTFRADLYWRLAHACIEVPPLRERRLDVAPLVDHFLGLGGTPALHELIRLRPRAAWVCADLIERYLLYDWPGNAREVREEVSRLSDIMRLRSQRNMSGPIPPVEEACSDRLARLPLPAATRPSVTAVDPAETLRYVALLQDPAGLSQAIHTEVGGNVKEFADRAAAVLGRNAGTMRRQIYRLLGEHLASMRKS